MGNREVSSYPLHNESSDFSVKDSIEYFDIVWYDEKSESNLLQIEQYSQQIKSLEGYKVRFFNDILQCGTYLHDSPVNAKIILIIQEDHEEELIKGLHGRCAIKIIFIVHLSINGNRSQFFPQFPKVRDIYLNDVAHRLRLFEARFYRNDKEFFSVDTFNVNQTVEYSSTEINGRFLFTRLLLDILLRMESKSSDKDEFISRCTQLFPGDMAALKNLKQFDTDYTSERVFEWYTKQTFIYRLLNKALRTQNIDLLFIYRFFLQDMQKQLVLHQERCAICVYRCQRISKTEWDKLSKATGRCISMNSFLSTSLKQSIAEFYMSAPIEDDKEIGILFEIKANPCFSNGSLQPFANIARFSAFPIEEEIVFMVGSIFRINEISVENSLPKVKMELCNNEEKDMKMLFESLRREVQGLQGVELRNTTLCSLGVYASKVKRYDIAEKFFRRAYYESSDNDPYRADCCQSIGAVCLHTGRYQESAQWFERALKLYGSQNVSNDLRIANVYIGLGSFYAETKKRRKALQMYQNALELYQVKSEENSLKIALCYHRMANLFERPKHYTRAVRFREEALQAAKNAAICMHPDLISYHTALAALLIDIRHRDLERALYLIQEALKIAENSIPSDDLRFPMIYHVTGEIHQLMGNFEQSNFWYRKIDDSDYISSPDIVVQKKLNRVKTFTCNWCHRRVWISRYFESMKDMKLNCLIFHEFGCLIHDSVRYCFHY